jgi:hypothetical protein
MLSSLVCVVIFITFLCCVVIIRAEVDCKVAGFNPTTLQCGTCESLNKIVGDVDLYSECKECCITPVEEVFEVAVLEIDKRMMSFAGEVKKAIKTMKKESKFDFTVKYKFGSRPTLQMFKAKSDDTPSDSIPVGNWDENMLTDYLKGHLKPKSV